MNWPHRAIAPVKTRRKGQTLIMFTLMITVLFGFVALVIDLGFAYSERRLVQNAADAGSLAGARALAGKIIATSDGGYAFTLTHQDVVNVVTKYVDDNKSLVPKAAVYEAPKIEYLDGSQNPLAVSNNMVPTSTQMVRVTRKLSFSTLFAPVIGQPKMEVSARATAKISPVLRPKYPPGPTWPMTRFDNNATPPKPLSGCPDPVLFWSGNPSGNTGTTANWKQLMYMGQKSAFVNQTKYGPTTYDHDQLITTFDPTYDPYSSVPPADLTGADVQVALEYWFRNGFKGQFTAGADEAPAPDAKDEPWTWNEGTDGDKVEVIGGNLGSNMSSAMLDYINNNIVGTDSCGGDYTIVYMYLWKESSAEKWRANQTPRRFEKTTGQQIDRVTLSRWEPFIFYNSSFSFPSASEIYGYWTSLEIGDEPPLPGPPSAEANTVHLVE